jgi:hypothetical protein
MSIKVMRMVMIVLFDRMLTRHAQVWTIERRLESMTISAAAMMAACWRSKCRMSILCWLVRIVMLLLLLLRWYTRSFLLKLLRCGGRQSMHLIKFMP